MKYRLTENKLRGIIREAVKGVLNESGFRDKSFDAVTQWKSGRAQKLFSLIQEKLNEVNSYVEELDDMGYNDPSTPHGKYVNGLRKMVKNYIWHR